MRFQIIYYTLYYLLLSLTDFFNLCTTHCTGNKIIYLSINLSIYTPIYLPFFPSLYLLLFALLACGGQAIRVVGKKGRKKIYLKMAARIYMGVYFFLSTSFLRFSLRELLASRKSTREKKKKNPAGTTKAFA